MDDRDGRRHARVPLTWALLPLALLLLVLAWHDFDAGPTPAPRAASTPSEDVDAAPPRLRGAPPPAHEPEAPDRVATTEGPGPALAVRVVDHRGRPVAGARVLVQRPSFSMFGGGQVTEVEVETDAQGVAAVPDRGRKVAIPHEREEDAPRRIRFSTLVRPPGDRPDLAPLAGAPWPPEGPLALPPGGVIEGVVASPEGRGLADVQVRIPRGWASAVRTDLDGRFRLAHLPLGQHALEVDVPGLATSTSDPAWTFDVGTFDARLELDVGASLRLDLPGDVESYLGGWVLVAPSKPRGEDVEPATAVRMHALPFTVHGLDAARRYTFHAVTREEPPRVAWASFVSPQAGSVRLALRPAFLLVVALELPEGPRNAGVRLEARVDGLPLTGSRLLPSDDGLSGFVEGVPVETAEVVAWTGPRAAPTSLGRVRATAGADNVLRLVPVNR